MLPTSRRNPMASCILLAALSILLMYFMQGPSPPQVFDPVSLLLVKAIEIPVGIVAAKLAGGLVTDLVLHKVLNDTRSCYEEFVCGKKCNEGFVPVESGTRGYDACWQRCCPEEPSSCYKSDKHKPSGCYEGYDAVEEWDTGRTCCPSQRPRCFTSSRCFHECPADFVRVEEKLFRPCDDLCCPQDTCFVGTECMVDCPANYTLIPINRSALTAVERAGFMLGDPLACFDLCCPTTHVQSGLLKDSFTAKTTANIANTVAGQASAASKAAVHEAAVATAAAVESSIHSAVDTIAAG